MASNRPGSGRDDDKFPRETTAAANNASQGEGANAASPSYDVDRIERVYKKLDRRIIPGKEIPIAP
jgi:hypothetical protein